MMVILYFYLRFSSPLVVHVDLNQGGTSALRYFCNAQSLSLSKTAICAAVVSSRADVAICSRESPPFSGFGQTARGCDTSARKALRLKPASTKPVCSLFFTLCINLLSIYILICFDGVISLHRLQPCLLPFPALLLHLD